MIKSPNTVAIERHGVSVRQAGQMGLGGPTVVYQLIKEGEVKSYLIGKRRFVTTASIAAYIKRRLEAAEATNGAEAKTWMAPAWTALAAKRAGGLAAPAEPTKAAAPARLKSHGRRPKRIPRSSNNLLSVEGEV
jgi:hypothetical protein